MPRTSPSILGTLGWACYLAVSWTWVIGMFFPVLLVRDYGFWGFVVFAVPNVIGAAAMGFVFTPKQSRRTIRRNRHAIVVFSAITYLFHAFFLDWMIGAGAMAFAILASSSLFDRSTGKGRALAVTTTLAAGTLLVLALLQSDNSERNFSSPDALGASLLLPVCIFGFALCPYLDSTFHNALIESKQRRRFAFAVGFGVVFLLFILGTLAYGFDDNAIATWFDTGEGPNTLLMFYITIQGMVTISMHASALSRIVREPSRDNDPRLALGVAIVFVVPALLGITNFAFGFGPFAAPDTLGELIYRLFMSCYGLLFPAYVWLCVIPTRDGHSGIAGPRGRRKLITLALACTLAAPLYWLGFIQQIEWWLIPGVAIPLLARLTLPNAITKPATAPVL